MPCCSNIINAPALLWPSGFPSSCSGSVSLLNSAALQTHNNDTVLISSHQQFGFVEIFQVLGGDAVFYIAIFCSLTLTQFQFYGVFLFFSMSEQHIEKSPYSLLWNTWKGYIY